MACACNGMPANGQASNRQASNGQTAPTSVMAVYSSDGGIGTLKPMNSAAQLMADEAVSIFNLVLCNLLFVTR